MSPRAAIREAIMCPLVKCYPAPKPKKSNPRYTPEKIQSVVWLNREKTKRYLRMVDASRRGMQRHLGRL
jgi:hypothetical protein